MDGRPEPGAADLMDDILRRTLGRTDLGEFGAGSTAGKWSALV